MKLLDAASRRPSLERRIGRVRTRDGATEEASERAAAKAVAGLAVASGLAAGAVVATRPPPDPSRWMHLLERDRPINHIAIPLAHNTGTEPGGGSIPLLASNQMLRLEELLDRTPIRAFELDLHERNGEVYVNHGGHFDPLVTHPHTMGAMTSTLNEWLEKPEHRRQVIYVMLETYLGAEGTERALQKMQQTFGDKLFTPAEQHRFFKEKGRWPTPRELTVDGPRVMIISPNVGTSRTVPFGARYIFEQFRGKPIIEDRTIFGNMGTHAFPGNPPHIDTKRFDQLRDRGNFTKIDKITEHDPRLYLPKDRANLAARPDVSILDTLYFATKTARAIVFATGVAMSVGSGALAILAGVFRALRHEDIIRRAPAHVASRLDEIALSEVLAARSRDFDAPVSCEELVGIATHALRRELRSSTAEAGVHTSLAISGSLMTFALLFPTAQPLLAMTATVGLCAGILATVTAVAINGRRLRRALALARENAALAQTASRKLEALTRASASPRDPEALLRDIRHARTGARLEHANRTLLWTALITRVSAAAKHAVSRWGRASEWSLAAALFTAGLVDALIAHRGRRARLDQPARLAAEAVSAPTHRKRFWVFGRSSFSRFVEAHKAAVRARLGAEAPSSTTALLAVLARPEHARLAQALRFACATADLRISVERFARKRGMTIDVEGGSEAQVEVLRAYIVDRVSRRAAREVFKLGALNTWRASGLVGITSLLVPPYAVFIAAAAAAVVPIGTLVSAIAALLERVVWNRKMRDALASPPDASPVHVARYEELSRFVSDLREQVDLRDP